MSSECGGCRGLGSHQRWCPWSVGASASRMGRQGEQAEALADSVGSNHPTAANHLYMAASLLVEEAKQRAEAWRESQ